MSTNDFLMLWVPCSAALLACRMVPALALRGRALPPRVVEALGLIPPAAFAALVLLVLAMTQLSAADDTFGELIDDLRLTLTLDLDETWFYRLLASLPVGAYVFGLLAGLGRRTPEDMRGRGAAVVSRLPKLRTVPEGIWAAALGLFSALYLVFFFVQGRYLFGAFTRTLPESFTVAEYAR